MEGIFPLHSSSRSWSQCSAPSRAFPDVGASPAHGRALPAARLVLAVQRCCRCRGRNPAVSQGCAPLQTRELRRKQRAYCLSQLVLVFRLQNLCARCNHVPLLSTLRGLACAAPSSTLSSPNAEQICSQVFQRQPTVPMKHAGCAGPLSAGSETAHSPGL